ncbi:hypothetical protein BC628DRAFT_549689 [Trametes gibbosa]|nr:hypothetical protein BC628DRAFT_549689 [Trametes gibbosa]
MYPKREPAAPQLSTAPLARGRCMIAIPLVGDHQLHTSVQCGLQCNWERLSANKGSRVGWRWAGLFINGSQMDKVSSNTTPHLIARCGVLARRAGIRRPAALVRARWREAGPWRRREKDDDRTTSDGQIPSARSCGRARDDDLELYIVRKIGSTRPRTDCTISIGGDALARRCKTASAAVFSRACRSCCPPPRIGLSPGPDASRARLSPPH